MVVHIVHTYLALTVIYINNIKTLICFVQMTVIYMSLAGFSCKSAGVGNMALQFAC